MDEPIERHIASIDWLSNVAPVKDALPLDENRLRELALAYVARFMTSEGKLAYYLSRKLRERGWAGDGDPPVALLVKQCADKGFVDDRSFAASKASALTRRGYGPARVRAALKSAGIADDIAAQESTSDPEKELEAALAFVRRRRIGPYARTPADAAQKRKWVAAILQAGHSFALARELANADMVEEM